MNSPKSGSWAIEVQLLTLLVIDTTTGTPIWADRIDGALDDVFELQDQVASKVAARSSRDCGSPRSSGRHASRPRASTLTICTCGLWRIHKYTEESLREAVTLAK